MVVDVLDQDVMAKWPLRSNEERELYATLHKKISRSGMIDYEPHGVSDPEPIADAAVIDAIKQGLSINLEKTAAPGENGNGIFYTVAVPGGLQDRTGVAGRLVFRQGDAEVKGLSLMAAGGSTPRHFHWLPGFEPGPMEVRFEYDPDVASRSRLMLDHVLTESFDLGVIELPPPGTVVATSEEPPS